VVIGGGMIAKAFMAYGESREVVIFASGVSNSLETSDAAFGREQALLEKVRAAQRQAFLVYFGTCSVDDPDRRATPYVQHKMRMEALLAGSSSPWMVLRLPLAIGPEHRSPTLANFLHDRIVRGEKFEVWARSSRYPIDIEDAFRLASRFIADRSLWRRTINIALRAFPVLDFVRVLERITGKRALYRLVEKGAHYDLRCPEVAKLASELELDFSPRYLERVLRRYF
jgi:nucleoside-diphosphate-sugar epimerase